MKKYILILLCLLSTNIQLFAQDDEGIDTLETKTYNELTNENPVSEGKFQMSKDPTTAIIYSLILPGLGQFYTEDYWKVPIFTGGSGTLVYFIIYNHDLFIENQDIYDSLEDDNADKELYNSRKEFYRNQRDLSGFYLLAVYLVATVDAYVGAHLYDFNVSDDLSMRIYPSVDFFPIGRAKINISFTLP